MGLIFREMRVKRFDKTYVLQTAVPVFLFLAAIYSTFRYLIEVSHGGQVWTTGDWLISYRAGFVRRGLTGSLTYALTDLTGLNALYIAAAMQITIYAGLIAAVLVMLSKIKITVPVALLALSPVFLLMPFYYLKLAMCKEMIGFLAISLVAMPAFTNHRWLFWAGIAVFSVSGFAHEINAFLAPDLLTLLFILLLTGVSNRTQTIYAAVIVIFSAGTAIILSMLYNGNGMGSAVCQAMLHYGGWVEFCGQSGPTVWLDRNMAYGIHFTWVENVMSGAWPLFILGFVLSIAPFLLFQVLGDTTGRKSSSVFILACAGILAYAPLFIIASDWGRWIAMHIFCLTIFTFVSLRLGLLKERAANINPIFLIYSFVWAMPDYGLEFTAGLLGKIQALISHAIRIFGA